MTQIRKLTLGLTVMAVVAFIWSFTSLNVIEGLSSYLRSSVGSTTAGIDQLGQIDRAISDMVGCERALVLHSLFGHEPQVKEYEKNFDAIAAALDKQIAALPPELTAGKSHDSAAALIAGLTGWKSAHVRLVGWLDKQQADEAEKLLRDQIQPIADRMQEASRSLSMAGTSLLQSGVTEAAAKSARSRWIAFLFLGVSTIIGLVVLLEVRRTGRRLEQVSAKVSSTVGEVGSAAKKVAEVSRHLSEWSGNQAASIEETSASSQQIESISRQNADNSRAVADLMNQVDRNVADTNRTLDQMIASMKEINSSSENIAKIIRVVDEIAFQTNILALNAAVEAARAGEAGLGFAVVAEEVRRLAQKSAQAAHDTSALIEQSVERSRAGTQNLDEMARTIAGITASASQVKGLVDRVSSASQEQSDGILQISKALAEIERITQQTTSAAQETLSAGEGLTEQAGTIRTVVRELSEVVGAGRTAHQN
jgi:methyl-accepting chemotaxis protein